jgi:formylglycine-generating enzyme required for sulfatase activity
MFEQLRHDYPEHPDGQALLERARQRLAEEETRQAQEQAKQKEALGQRRPSMRRRAISRANRDELAQTSGGTLDAESTRAIASEMILIPRGSFRVGLTKEQLRPAGGAWRSQYADGMRDIPTFRIAKFPVTNAEYSRFVKAAGHRPPNHWGANVPPAHLLDHPVVHIGRGSAEAYCRWLSKERGQPFRLPTEWEWEKAARGTDGRLSPWGNVWDKSRCHVGKRTTAPVNAHTPDGDSPYGVADMVGNVREWTASTTPDGSAVTRGGGFLASNERQVLCAARDTVYPGPKASIGFRVALSV